jgi:ABC-type glutathione transport system ATPase component
MYKKPSELDLALLYQGDVIDNFPLLVIKHELSFLRQSGSDFNVMPAGEIAFSGSPEEFVAAKARKSRVMLLSQTCDLQQREFVMVAPIYSMADLESKGALKDGMDGLIRKRRVNYWFYLPALAGVMEESLVDFQHMHYISRSFAEDFKTTKLLSLSDWGNHHLGWALGAFFGRPVEKK